MKITLLICVLLSMTSLAFAQAPPSPSTSPSAASSPHQRDTTSTPTKEAPTPNSPEPAAASSPHQKEVIKGSDKAAADKAALKSEKMLSECISKRQSANSSLSQDDAKKACVDQMKRRDTQ
jgi:hypothetical protein